MRIEDFPGVVKITKDNTFQYPFTSLYSWMTYDPEGIQVAVSKTGTVLGVCSVIKNSENQYFGGILCVGKEYRDLDVGHKLFDKVTSRVKTKFNIGCNVSSDHLNSYKRRDFVVLESNWSSIEYETFDTVDPLVLSDDLPPDVEIIPYHDELFSSISCCDRSVVNMDRTDVLDLSLHEDDYVTLVALQKGACIGYGSIKLSILGAGRIGPLCADDQMMAEVMIRRLILGLPKAKGVAMVTMSSNLHANKLMKQLGVGVYDKYLRVYTKARLPCNDNKIYAQFDIDFSAF